MNADEIGVDALSYASLEGQKDIVKILLKAGVDFSTAHNGCNVFLLAAAQNGHKAIVQILLNAGVDLNRGDKGRSALNVAAINGHKDTVQILLNAGVNLNIGDNGGKALNGAVLEGHKDIARLIIAINIINFDEAIKRGDEPPVDLQRLIGELDHDCKIRLFGTDDSQAIIDSVKIEAKAIVQEGEHFARCYDQYFKDIEFACRVRSEPGLRDKLASTIYSLRGTLQIHEQVRIAITAAGYDGSNIRVWTETAPKVSSDEDVVDWLVRVNKRFAEEDKSNEEVKQRPRPEKSFIVTEDEDIQDLPDLPDFSDDVNLEVREVPKHLPDDHANRKRRGEVACCVVM